MFTCLLIGGPENAQHNIFIIYCRRNALRREFKYANICHNAVQLWDISFLFYNHYFKLVKTFEQEIKFINQQI